MKDYAGQRRFQAPVADDFARGMLAPGQTGIDERELLMPLRGTLRSMVKQLKALWRG